MIAYHTLENLEFRLGDAELAQVGRCEAVIDVAHSPMHCGFDGNGYYEERVEFLSVRIIQDLLFAGDDLPDLCIIKGSELVREDFIQSALDDIEAGILQDRR